MKTLVSLAAATALTLSASAAQAIVLTFDGDICSGGTSCSNGLSIDQTYGDGVGVDVVFSNNVGGSLQFWDTAYSDLSNIAYSGGSSASVFLYALSGYSITLNGFDLGAWPTTSRNTQVTIREIGGADLFSSGPILVSGAVRSSFSGAYTSTSGIEINFGPDSFNVGIDNIDFTVTATGAIPEPHTWAMMILGFGAAGSLLRRRQRMLA
jgi:hypothetical protein